MRFRLRHLVLAVVLLSGSWLHASERIPSVPEKYFNDYTGTVSPTTVSALNQQLEQYERASSNQLLVVVYSKMESDSSLEDYTVRVARSWHVGQKEKKNGAVLFVFKNDRKLRIEVGYGLEPTLTDATCHDIIESILKPRFRQGNFEQGLTEATSAMIAATKGEYRGTGRTHAESRSDQNAPTALLVLFFIATTIVIMIAFFARRINRTSIFQNPTRRSSTWQNGGVFGGGLISGSSSDSSSSGDSGGSFSSGGGDFGGGGSSGSW